MEKKERLKDGKMEGWKDGKWKDVKLKEWKDGWNDGKT